MAEVAKKCNKLGIYYPFKVTSYLQRNGSVPDPVITVIVLLDCYTTNVLLFVYVRVSRCLVIKNIVVKHHQEVAKNLRKEKLHVNTKLQGIKVQDNQFQTKPISRLLIMHLNYYRLSSAGRLKNLNLLSGDDVSNSFSLMKINSFVSII